MIVNAEIAFRDFLKIDFLDQRGLWLGRQYTYWGRLLMLRLLSAIFTKSTF